MLKDCQYQNYGYAPSLQSHSYGAQVHILQNPALFSLLADLSSQNVIQPQFNHLLKILYQGLLWEVINQEFGLNTEVLKTRMANYHPEESELEIPRIPRETKAVCVSLARAGILPSQVCFDTLHLFLNASHIRQDHISINRKTNDQNEVVGTQLGGLKIGGGIEESIVLIPDPMGATGSTLITTLDLYRELGKAKKLIAMHLIVTPEYLKKVTEAFPQLIIYALRVDRGLSTNEILSTPLGSRWAEEKGLNQNQYIVPGAGGVGELINNAFV